MGEVVKFEQPLTAEEEREFRECLERISDRSEEMERIDKGYGVVGSRNGVRALEKEEDAVEAFFGIMTLSQGPTDE